MCVISIGLEEVEEVFCKNSKRLLSNNWSGLA